MDMNCNDYSMYEIKSTNELKWYLLQQSFFQEWKERILDTRRRGNACATTTTIVVVGVVAVEEEDTKKKNDHSHCFVLLSTIYVHQKHDTMNKREE